MFKFAIYSGNILSKTFMIPLAKMHRFQSRICCLNVEARNGNLKLSCLLYEVSCPIIACCESCPLEAYAVLSLASQPCRRLWSCFASTTPNCRISAWRPFTLSGGISGIMWTCLMDMLDGRSRFGRCRCSGHPGRWGRADCYDFGEGRNYDRLQGQKS